LRHGLKNNDDDDDDDDDLLFIFTVENMTVLFPATIVVTFKVTNK
jgi:hypothetical protein